MPKLGDLACYVLDDDGNTVWFQAGADVPSWAAKQMGDHCFAGQVVPDEGDDDAEESDGGDEDDAPPPQSGAGSGVKAWRTYAGKKGFDPEGLDRDEIIAALTAEGVRVE